MLWFLPVMKAIRSALEKLGPGEDRHLLIEKMVESAFFERVVAFGGALSISALMFGRRLRNEIESLLPGFKPKPFLEARPERFTLTQLGHDLRVSVAMPFRRLAALIQYLQRIQIKLGSVLIHLPVVRDTSPGTPATPAPARTLPPDASVASIQAIEPPPIKAVEPARAPLGDTAPAAAAQPVSTSFAAGGRIPGGPMSVAGVPVRRFSARAGGWRGFSSGPGQMDFANCAGVGTAPPPRELAAFPLRRSDPLGGSEGLRTSTPDIGMRGFSSEFGSMDAPAARLPSIATFPCPAPTGLRMSTPDLNFDSKLGRMEANLIAAGVGAAPPARSPSAIGAALSPLPQPERRSDPAAGLGFRLGPLGVLRHAVRNRRCGLALRLLRLF